MAVQPLEASERAGLDVNSLTVFSRTVRHQEALILSCNSASETGCILFGSRTSGKRKGFWPKLTSRTGVSVSAMLIEIAGNMPLFGFMLVNLYWDPVVVLLTRHCARPALSWGKLRMRLTTSPRCHARGPRAPTVPLWKQHLRNPSKAQLYSQLPTPAVL
eukprot:scaffold65124_cov60-Phaeocystis_antarctica.AAC.1